MTQFLLQLGIMSIQATIIIFVVLLLRFFFSKIHIAKKYTNLLWIIPYIAMILPWGIKTPFSFWQITQAGQAKIERTVNTMSYMAEDLVQEEKESLVMQEMIDNHYAPPTLEDKVSSSNRVSIPSGSQNILTGVTTWDIFIWGLFTIWLLGIIIFLMYGVVGSLKLKKKLVCSLLLKENVYVADDIKEPFVFGVFSPKIYLPYNLTIEDEYYVVEHEKTHIRRKDPIKKILAFVITGIHWFNPFVWFAFHMMAKDMEMACDEETVQRIGLQTRKEYATALLKLSVKKRNLFIPVAFGEGNVKSRIKNVLKYKKTFRVLAVIAAFLILFVAVVFLTKPIDKVRTMADIRFLDNHDELMRPPVEGKQRGVIVIYEGEEYAFDESFYDTFRIFLEELELYEESKDRSRSEDRPADVVIQIEGGATYNFDEKMETIWCDDGVKPSFSYEVVSPKKAILFIAAQIAVCEGNPAIYDEDVQQSEETPSITDMEICGENGPFLDYADEKYIVFHTAERFYLYDRGLNEVSMKISFHDIFKVEVDAQNLEACVHDVEGDMITIYECDFTNLSYCLYGPIDVDAFDDFLLTDECVIKDTTVFRTKECIQMSDGSYLYLESGSGLLQDLCFVCEDMNGNRTDYEIFDTTTYETFGDTSLQLFTGAYYMEPLDITHDGKDEYIVVDFNGIQSDSQAPAYLKVTDVDGNVLWQNELGLARAGWNSYYIVWTKEGVCLLEYLPVVMQERGEYAYRLFYLNEDGSEVELSGGNVNFLIHPDNEDIDAETVIPKKEMQAFAEDVNQYLESARMLISTVNGILQYQTPAKTYSYKEVYQMPLEVLELDVSESIELNITKLQNYYENYHDD